MEQSQSVDSAMVKPMPIHVSWVAMVAVCVGASSTVAANMISFVMIGKINEQLPEAERMSYLWWGTNLRKRFKQLYPANKLVFLLDSAVVIMFISFVCLIKFWVFG